MSTTQKIRSIGREARVNELISERLEHWKATMRERGEFFNVIHSRVSHRHFHFVCDQVQCGSKMRSPCPSKGGASTSLVHCMRITLSTEWLSDVGAVTSFWATLASSVRLTRRI